jgi:hypothetical protein
VSGFRLDDGRPCSPPIVTRQRLRNRLPADEHRAKLELLFGPDDAPPRAAIPADGRTAGYCPAAPSEGPAASAKP